MSAFDINNEVNTLVDKLTEQFKARLKKLILRREKIVVKQYIASQKETLRATRGTHSSKSKAKPKARSRTKPKARAVSQGRGRAKRVPQREREYEYNPDEFISSDDSE